MASPCDNRLTVNIKNLPIITDINRGDFLIVETPDGTGILDFRNFLITLDNTTFSSTFLNYNTQINTVSAEIKDLSLSTETAINALSTSTSESITRLESLIDATSSLNVLNNTFATFSSDGETVQILNSYNINNGEVLTNGSIRINFKTNFTDPNYCVMTAGGYYYDEDTRTSSPLNLAITQTTTNSVTFNVLSSGGAPLSSVNTSVFTRAWLSFKTGLQAEPLV